MYEQLCCVLLWQQLINSPSYFTPTHIIWSLTQAHIPRPCPHGKVGGATNKHICLTIAVAGGINQKNV